MENKLEVPIESIESCAYAKVLMFHGVDTAKISTEMIAFQDLPVIHPDADGLVTVFYCPHIRAFDLSKEMILTVSVAFSSSTTFAPGDFDFTMGIEIAEIVVLHAETYDPSVDDPGGLSNPFVIHGSTTPQDGFLFTYHGKASHKKSIDMSFVITPGIITHEDSAMLLRFEPLYMNTDMRYRMFYSNFRISGTPRWSVNDN